MRFGITVELRTIGFSTPGIRLGLFTCLERTLCSVQNLRRLELRLRIAGVMTDDQGLIHLPLLFVHNLVGSWEARIERLGGTSLHCIFHQILGVRRNEQARVVSF